MGCFLTVFTPTYNRGYTLPRLYASLCAQTMRDFEWVVVDDGSTDNTRELVEGFISDNKVNIKYYYKQNGGKHTAINYGMEHASGEWLFMVDSDDYLTEDSLCVCNQRLSEIAEPDVAGIVGLKGKTDGTAWSSWQHEKGADERESAPCLVTDAITYRYKMRLHGDRAEIVRTDIIRKYPFPVFDGEKFISENYLWLNLAKDGYKFAWFDKVVYVAEYLEDGLTKNINGHYIKNPQGRCCVDNLKVSCKSMPWKERLKASVNYYRYGLCGGIAFGRLFKNANGKYFSPIAVPMGFVMSTRMKR